MAKTNTLVVKLDMHDDSDRKKVMKIVTNISDLNSLAVDLKEQELTVTGGDFDPVKVVRNLRKKCWLRRKSWHADMKSFGPTKKEEEESKKDEEGKHKAIVYPYIHQPPLYCYPADENPYSCAIS